MNHHQLKIRVGVVGLGVALALAPAAPAFAGLHKAKSHHKAKKKKVASSSSKTCPTTALLSTASGTTYTDLQSMPGAEKGWTVCQYNADGSIALLVSLYPSGTSLKSITANVPVTPKKLSGIGNAAAHYGNEVYVSQKSAPSFSVIDQSGDLTLTQVEAEAKAIVAG